MLGVDEARARARAMTGLAPFSAPGFDEGLHRTLDAFARIPLLPEARAAAEARVVADLAQRTRIEQAFARSPRIRETPVEGPILVFGLPRTGTTATVAMMALDARLRFLRAWEASEPLPPPVLAEEARDPRALAARASAAGYTNQAQHLFDPDGPEEDMVMLAGLDMASYHGAYPMPDDFIDWWIARDFAPTYALHEKVLQILHSERPPHLWLVKAPVHLFQLEAFAQTYPDARFVMTHRDPAKVIASDASLRYRLHGERCPASSLDKTAYGPKLCAFWRRGMDRALAARRAIGEDRFVDLRNEDLVRDPVGTFEALYRALGMEMTGDMRSAIADYLARNARGAHGEHRYTAEEYGTSAGHIRGTFADYCDRFGV